MVAKKAQDQASPYSQMMQRMEATCSELAKVGVSARLVAKVILNAETNFNPNLRYLVGKDVEAWAAGKKTMDKTEFFNMIKNVTK